MSFFRLCALAGLAAGHAACDSTRSTHDERVRLYRERDEVQDRLNEIAPRSRWAQHADTESMIERRNRIDEEIRQLE